MSDALVPFGGWNYDLSNLRVRWAVRGIYFANSSPTGTPFETRVSKNA